MVSNAVDTVRFLRSSAPSVNVVSNSNKRGQTAGVTGIFEVAKSLDFCNECPSDGNSN